MNLFRLLKNNSGVVTVEFVLVVPVLLLLFLGGFELTRFVLLYQKVSKTTSTMSDLISRLPSVTEAEIDNSYNAVQHLMEPYYNQANIKVVMTSIINDGDDNYINWQRCGGGDLVANSALGQEGGVVTLPAGFSLEEGEDTIVAEVFYSFTPVIAPDTIAAQEIYKIRYTKPRLGALISISDNDGVTGC